MQGAKTYFWLSALSFPSLALYNACAALYRAMGNSKVSMLTSLLMNLVNIVGNAILIYGFGLGVAGAAIASLFSRTLGAILMLFLIVRPTHAIFISKLYRPSLHADMVGRILRIGIPNGLENSMFQVGKLLVQGLIASFGTSAIAANAIANSVASLANTPGAAIGLGLVTVVGQCMGARAPDQAVHYTRRLMRLTYLCMGVFDVMLFLLAGPLVRMFHLSPEAASSATFILRTFAVSAIFLWPLSFTTPNALRAAGDARFTMLTSILSMWLFRIGLSYVFGRFFHMGVLGVWIAMYVDWAVRALAFTLRFERGKWRHIQVI
ncbi:MAG: MATE family efflux transporter [Clostridia bacterium]